MRAKQNFIPVNSDVDDYLDQSRSMFDNEIAEVFKELKISSIMKRSTIQKRCGHPAHQIIFSLFLIPFLSLGNVFLLVREQYEEAANSAKNKYYRFLANAKFNWRSFQLSLCFRVHQKVETEPDQKLFFVIDSTITQVTGKLIELASYIYDHTVGKSVLGFEKLHLGIFNGKQFLPIGQRVCVGKKKPKAKSKASKYKKQSKAKKISPDSPGAAERAAADQTKLDKVISMLKAAINKGFEAPFVMFDSWFCFNCLIVQIKTQLGLDVILQLKNMPKTNKYVYKGKSYTLKELYGYFARPKMRMVKKHQFKQAILTVCLVGSIVKMKIVFVHNDGQDKWHAFGSTDTKLKAETILNYYSYRWSIEVFFKNCKQYLNYGKEQMSNLDSIIACDALVLMRYTVLTYLASKENARFYEKFDTLRSQQKATCFGMRLLKYYLNQLEFIINEACVLIQNDQKKEAIELLSSLVNNPEKIAAGALKSKI